jgi:branched-chain amino acid transport system permease protein
MDWLPLFLEQAFNGLQLGMLLFLMAAGLTLVFGIVNFINLAHGTQFMLGAYLAVTIGRLTGSYLLGVAGALVGTLVIGVALEALLFRRLYERDHLDQVLCTFGVILILNEAAKMIWGPEPLHAPIPVFLGGHVQLLGGADVPVYRLAIIAVGLLVTALLYLVVSFTRAGMLIRACASNHLMLGLLGADVSRIHRAIFGGGALLAGLAGAMAAPLFSVTPGMGDEMVIVAFSVVIIGGLGSVKGALAGGLLIGMVDTLGRAYAKPLLSAAFSPSTSSAVAPALASMLVYLLMALVLLLRPEGLLPPSGVRRAGHAAAPSVGRRGTAFGMPETTVFQAVGLFLLLLAFPLLAAALRQPFLLDLVARFMIFSIAALSLGLILGFGGLVSFGQALYLGLGAYAVGILAHHGVMDAASQWITAVAASAAVALMIGTVALRTRGSFFIMITLAFSQMFYYVGLSLHEYGGDDGMPLPMRSLVPYLDLAEPLTFYYLCLGALVLVFFGLRQAVRAKFGLALRGVRSNDRQMQALGYGTFGLRMLALVIAGAVCGFAGALLANSTQFVGPHFMHWARSGDLMTMVILGGVGTFLGPVFGAFALLGLEKYLADLTEHWPILLGVALIVVVLSPAGGINGLLSRLGSRLPKSRERRLLGEPQHP